MKIVVPSWGLGNVMFQYAFLCGLRARYNEPCCFLVHKQLRFDHQGYELDRLFKIQPYRGLNLIQKAYIRFVELLSATGFRYYYLFINLFFKWMGVKENFIYYDEVFQCPKKNIFFMGGTWQSPKYFACAKQDVLDTFCFDRSLISPYTRDILHRIETAPCSVSLHIRRGDYLKPEFEALGKCCTPDYYGRAIRYMTERTESPVFFVFSDDMDYVRENIRTGNMVYVDGNRGKDSWQDMFLMSMCRHNIIANSTFSWWGAYLNVHPDKIVIAPRQWWYYLERDDVTPEEWIRM